MNNIQTTDEWQETMAPILEQYPHLTIRGLSITPLMVDQQPITQSNDFSQADRFELTDLKYAESFLYAKEKLQSFIATSWTEPDGITTVIEMAKKNKKVPDGIVVAAALSLGVRIVYDLLKPVGGEEWVRLAPPGYSSSGQCPYCGADGMVRHHPEADQILPHSCTRQKPGGRDD